jgi:hypothetical protein
MAGIAMSLAAGSCLPQALKLKLRIRQTDKGFIWVCKNDDSFTDAWRFKVMLDSMQPDALHI